MGEEIILKCDGISKTFGPTRALQSVGLTVSRGEIKGLIGENGSGKSTLSSIIAGVQKPDCGRMELLGKPYMPQSVVDAKNAGVSLIVQEMGTLSGLSVAENVFVGNLESFTRHGLIDNRFVYQKANEILKQLGIEDITAEQSIDELNFEDRKIVEMARAMYTKPTLLIVDETTTALAQKGRKILYQLIERMHLSGNSVLFISHDLDEVMQICTNVTVLRDGIWVDTLEKERMQVNTMRMLMVGRELQDNYYRSDYDTPICQKKVLEAKNIFFGHSLKNVSFCLHEGEILGIGGLANSGMHEIGKVLMGIQKPAYGDVVLTEQEIRINNPPQAVRHGMGYVSKNRDSEALVQEASIRDNIVAASYRQLSKMGIITPQSERSLSSELVEQLSIKCVSDSQYCSELSGGNKQKVALAKWIANKSKILILDCPTRGIDVGIKAAIYKLINKLRHDGISIVLISEELAELIGMSDRILILKNGTVSTELKRSKQLTEQLIVSYML